MASANASAASAQAKQETRCLAQPFNQRLEILGKPVKLRCVPIPCFGGVATTNQRLPPVPAWARALLTTQWRPPLSLSLQMKSEGWPRAEKVPRLSRLQADVPVGQGFV